MRYCVISSGSKGNCTYIGTKLANILIDVGIGKKYLASCLSCCGLDANSSLSIDDIDKVIFTHSHSDHTSGMKHISPSKYLCLPKGLNNIEKRNRDLLQDIQVEQYLTFYEPYLYKDLKITPLPLSHDATNTAGYLIENEDESLVYITDTGYIKDRVLKLIKNCTYYIFESNHDTKMLFESSRPYDLIRRIHSDKGHLDNIASASYLADLIGDKTKEVVLAHLSEECNTPELALEAYKKVLIDKLGEFPSRISFRCASMENMTFGGDFLKR